MILYMLFCFRRFPTSQTFPAAVSTRTDQSVNNFSEHVWKYIVFLSSIFRICMVLSFMVFQRLIIGTELLTVRTKIAATVDMLGLNVLVEVGLMTSTVLAV